MVGASRRWFSPQYGAETDSECFGLTAEQATAFARANAQAFRTRAERIIQRTFGTTQPGTDAGPVFDELIAHAGSPSYIGPKPIPDANCGALNPFYFWVGLADAAVEFQTSINTQLKSYNSLVGSLQRTTHSPDVQAHAGAATGGGPRVVRHRRIRRGHRAVLRIKLPRAFVRTLAQTAGKHARFVALRVIVEFSAKPRPVAELVDVRVRVKR